MDPLLTQFSLLSLACRCNHRPLLSIVLVVCALLSLLYLLPVFNTLLVEDKLVVLKYPYRPGSQGEFRSAGFHDPLRATSTIHWGEKKRDDI
ncbi:hypothetical protein GY45DRAFT_344157 [Cubamyces sp. BRFM 1775]|nr:hypothetical protein GY45DRAFT_344157 [Cubamyces sp. BRFM 1775]